MQDIKRGFGRVFRGVLLGALVAWTLSGLALAAEETIMTGSYVTPGEYPDTGSIEATFIPAGEGVWDVVFDFDFQESDYTFSGTAEGSLSDGLLTGTVTNESGKRTFVFVGTVEKGRFEGEHAELEHGGQTPTGTMTLEKAEPADGP